MAKQEEDLSDLFSRREAPDREVVSKIEARLTTNLVPVEPIARPIAFALLFIAALVAISVLSLVLLRVTGWNSMDMLTKAAVFGALSAAVSVLALSLAQQMVPGSRVYVSSISLLGGVGVFLLVVFACCFQIQAEPRFLSSGLVCLQVGTPFAIPMALLLYWIVRRGLILSEPRVFATVGFLAGLVSVTVLELHCPNFDLLHILTWHLGIPVAGAILGAVWARVGRGRQP